MLRARSKRGARAKYSRLPLDCWSRRRGQNEKLPVVLGVGNRGIPDRLLVCGGVTMKGAIEFIVFTLALALGSALIGMLRAGLL